MSAAPLAARDWMLAFFRGEPVTWQASRDFLRHLVECARSERAQVLLYEKLLARGECIGLPAGEVSRIAGRYRQECALEMLRQGELLRVMHALTRAGLPFLLFKGTPLAYTLYREPCVRARCDTDILLPDRQAAETAWRVLQGLGYVRMNTAEGELLSYQFPCSLVSAMHSVMLDVHWAISNSAALRCLSFQELYAASEAVPGLGPGSRAPCPAHALVLACLHRLGHVKDAQHNKLIWLYDIQLLQDVLDDRQWCQFLDCVQEKGLGSACRDGLQQATRYFGAGGHPGRLDSLRSLATRPGQQFEVATSLLARDLAHLRQQAGIRRRLQLLGEYLFPSAHYMAGRFQPRWRCLLPYYYLKRIALGTARRVRAHLAGRR